MSQFSYLVVNMVVNDMAVAASKVSKLIFGQILHVYLTIKAETCTENFLH